MQPQNNVVVIPPSVVGGKPTLFPHSAVGIGRCGHQLYHVPDFLADPAIWECLECIKTAKECIDPSRRRKSSAVAA